MTLAESLRIILPYINLVLVVVVIAFFIKILSIKNEKTYIIPWKVLLFAVLSYTVEEILTIIDLAGIIQIPEFIFPLIEMLIICSFIYMVILQKKYIEMRL